MAVTAEGLHSVSREAFLGPQFAGEGDSFASLPTLDYEGLSYPYASQIDLDSSRGYFVEMSDLFPHLSAGEQPVSIRRFGKEVPEAKLTSEEVLLKLGNVSHVQDLGVFPLKAAIAAEGSRNIEEFKRFETLFGRDSLVATLLLDDIYPQLTRRTVLRLSEKQGMKFDRASEEEPGKILHEDRAPDDPVGLEITKERGWKFPYFGSIDATALFIQAAMKECTRDPGLLETRINNGERTVGEALQAAKEYLARKQDESLTGLIEHRRMNDSGIENQNWKDSGDSLSRKDGSLPDPDSPKAFLEVQVYTLDAFMDMADYYQQSDPTLADNLRRRSDVLKEQLFERFWVEDASGGYFAPALERVTGDNGDELIPFEIRTSNMGHTLNSRLLEGEDPEIVRKREAVLLSLHGSDMRAVSGFRTLSSREKRFKPTAYHNGNVWYFDSMLTALGEKRHGYTTLSQLDMQDIYQAVQASGMMPEFGKGSDAPYPEWNEREVLIYSEADKKHNLIEQLPQQYQLWTAATMRRIEEEINCWGFPFPITPVEQECLSMMKRIPGTLLVPENRFVAD